MKSDAKFLREDDILISMANSRELVGKVSFVNRLAATSTFGGFIAAIRSLDPVTPKYLFYFLRMADTQNALRQRSSQTVNIANLSLDGIYSTNIPLAPTAEQARIVDAIETQFTRLDAGVAGLKQIQAKLKRYRAAVLKAAIEGALTEAWRAQHPAVEPAPVLLQRILHERRAAWEQAELAKYAKAGKTPPKGWQAKYQNPAPENSNGLPRLPDSWCWTTLSSVAALKGGITKGQHRRPEQQLRLVVTVQICCREG